LNSEKNGILSIGTYLIAYIINTTIKNSVNYCS